MKSKTKEKKKYRGQDVVAVVIFTKKFYHFHVVLEHVLFIS